MNQDLTFDTLKSPLISVSGLFGIFSADEIDKFLYIC